jgi:hypothetical protein
MSDKETSIPKYARDPFVSEECIVGVVEARTNERTWEKSNPGKDSKEYGLTELDEKDIIIIPAEDNIVTRDDNGEISSSAYTAAMENMAEDNSSIEL